MTRNQRSLDNYGFLHDFLSHDDSYDYEYAEYEKGEDDEESEVGKYIFMLEFMAHVKTILFGQCTTSVDVFF